MSKRQHDDDMKTEEREQTQKLEGLLGLGQFSAHKSYYPELQKKIDELEREKHKYKRIFTEALYGIFQTDQDGKLIIANPALALICGYDSPEEMLEMGDISTQLFVDEKEAQRFFKDVAEEGSLELWETAFRDKNGRVIDVSLSASIIDTGEQSAIEVFVQDISEKKQAERELRRSEERLRTTLDSIGDAVIATDTDGRVIRMNPVAEELTGWPFTEAKGQRLEEVFNIVNAKTRESVENPVVRVIRSGRIVGLANHTLLLSRDGSEYQIADSAAPIRDTNGELHGVVMVFRDVTEDYRLRDQLEANEAFLNDVFNSIQDGVSILDNDMNIIRVNKMMNTWYKKHFPLEGKKCYTTYHHIDQPCEDCPSIRCRESGKTESNVVRGMPGSEIEWVELFSYPIKDKETDRVVGVVEFVHNITNQRRAEDELSRIFKMSLDMICIADLDTTNFLKINPAFTRILGYDENELLNHPFIEFIHPDDVQTTLETMEQKLKSGEDVVDFSNRYRCKDGSYRMLRWVSHPDIVRGVMYASAHDITDFIERQEAIERSETKFRSIIESTPLGIHLFYLDDKGIIRFEDCNSAAKKILGFDHADLIGLPIDEAVPMLKKNPLMEKYYRTITEGVSMEFENEFIDYNQKKHIFSVNAFQTEPLKMAVVFQDITEKKKAEADLRESEDRFRSITEQISDMIYLTDERGIIKYVSPASVLIFNMEPEEMIGHPFTDFLAPESIEVAVSSFKESMSGGVSSENLELNMRRKGGTIFLGELTGKLYQHSVTKGNIGVIRDISDRKKAEQSLRESEELFRTLYNNLPGGMVLIDEDYRIVNVNKRTCEITGYTRDELVGQLCDIICPKGSISKKCPIWEVGQEGFEGMDTFIKCKDQTFNPILKNARRVMVNGKEHILEVFQDIREQKEIEGALRESETRMRSIFRAAPVGIGISSERIIQTVNDRFEEITGYTRAEIVGKNTRFLYASEHDYRKSNEMGQVLIRSEGIGTVETRFLHKDNRIIDVLLGIAPLNPENLSMGETFTILDITDRKKAEAEIRLQALVLSQIRDCVTVTDLTGKITYVNEAQSKEMGRPREDFIGSSVRQFSENTEKGISQEEIISKTLEDGNWEGRVYNYNSDGKEVIMDTRTQLVYDESGKKFAMCGIATDITERLELEREREKLQEQYYQAMKLESIGRLAGGVAHDLNNLLTPVLGYGELLMLEEFPDIETRESVRQIVNAATRAKDLVSQLLAFSRKQTLRFELVDVNSLVKRFEKLLRMTIREDIKMDIQLSDQALFAEGDIGQLEQVVMNLAVNAQDAMPHGGRLSISTSQVSLEEPYITAHEPIDSGKYIVLSVSDSGHGMDKETQKQIFEPFFTTKNKHKGTGLGLATVYGIVKQHEGGIMVRSEMDKGTTFEVYLPLARGSVEILEDDSSPASHSFGGAETILLVEDDEQVLKLAESILKHHGYIVIKASNGVKALEKLSMIENKIDLLVTDVVMPEMNGKQLYDEVIERIPDIRVLFMSGYTDDVIATRGILDSGLHYIQKPFTVQSLAARVREALDEHSE